MGRSSAIHQLGTANLHDGHGAVTARSGHLCGKVKEWLTEVRHEIVMEYVTQSDHRLPGGFPSALQESFGGKR
jgi:hypothetical protein